MKNGRVGPQERVGSVLNVVGVRPDMSNLSKLLSKTEANLEEKLLTQSVIMTTRTLRLKITAIMTQTSAKP